MAAGEGRRLRPLTERWPKPILPIDGRAVIATLLRQLADEGLGPVTVVTGHFAEQIEQLLAGLDVRFVRQPEPHGSADAVRRALAGGADLPAIVTGADTVFRPGDLAVFAGRFTESDAPGALAYRRHAGKVGVRVENGLLRAFEEPDAPYSSAPLWGLTDEISLEELPGPPFELRAAFQAAMAAGRAIAAVEIGPTRDLTWPDDLVRENFPYVE